MKQAIILAILLVLVAGCSTMETSTISGTQELVLNEQDIQEIGIRSNLNEEGLKQLGIEGDGVNCWTDNAYSNIVDTSAGQYTICAYLIPSLNDTEVIVELQKFANYEALDGSYQYSSSHLYGVKGIISRDEYGDKSVFRVNSEDDYGAEFNEPGVYYYHLWICKDLYLIHVTSGGRSREAGEYVKKIGEQILSKFG